MSWSWFKNLAGFNLPEAELNSIPHPYAELTVHVTIKTVQAFGLLGTCVVGPLVALTSSSTRNGAGVASSATKCGKWGAVAGLVAGPLMTYGRLQSAKADEEAVYDRCYRLRYNRDQVDLASLFHGQSASLIA